MTASCPEAWVTASWVDGELAPERAREVEEHVRACAACAAIRDDVARVDARVKALAAATPVPTRAEWDRMIGAARPRRTSTVWLLVAASLLLTLVPATLAYVLRPCQGGESAELVASVGSCPEL